MKLITQSSSTSLVNPIQQYVNDLYINQAASNFGLPNDMLPTLDKKIEMETHEKKVIGKIGI